MYIYIYMHKCVYTYTHGTYYAIQIVKRTAIRPSVRTSRAVSPRYPNAGQQLGFQDGKIRGVALRCFWNAGRSIARAIGGTKFTDMA